MIRYLLDTNVISEASKVNPDRRVLRKLVSESHRCCSSAIVWSEILYGVARLPDGKRKDRLTEFVRGVGRQFPMLGFGPGAAEVLAEARTLMAMRGVTPPQYDAMIAATAMYHGLTLVTRDVAHFAEFPGLTVERWHS